MQWFGPNQVGFAQLSKAGNKSHDISQDPFEGIADSLPWDDDDPSLESIKDRSPSVMPP